MNEEIIFNKLKQDATEISYHQFKEEIIEEVDNIEEFQRSKGNLFCIANQNMLIKNKVLRYKLPSYNPIVDPVKDIIDDFNGKNKTKTDKLQNYEIGDLQAQVKKNTAATTVLINISKDLKALITGVRDDYERLQKSIKNDMDIKCDIIEQRLKEVIIEKLKKEETKPDTQQ